MRRPGALPVLMTVDAVGGVWSYAVTLAAALAPHGVQFTFAAMGGALSDAQRAEAAAIPGLVLKESAYRLEWMQDCAADVAASGKWLLELARETRPDIVHLNSYSPGAERFASPVLMVAHSDVCSWWRAVHGERAPADWDDYRARLRAGLGGADLVVAPSAAMGDALIREHGEVARLAVIRNGIALDRFRPGAKRPLILGAGRVWDKAKNLAALDRAAADLPWRVEIAGPLQLEGGEATLGHAKALGCLSQAELARKLGEAAIYALPALYEPFGLSVLEAAASGCALVLGDIPSLRELWGENALFVPPQDAVALRNALQLLIELPAARQELAVRAYERAQRFAAERMAAAYLAEYRALLTSRLAAAE